MSCIRDPSHNEVTVVVLGAFIGPRPCNGPNLVKVKEVDIGAVADVGTLQRLPKVIGSQSLVNDLCFTARKMFSGKKLTLMNTTKVLYMDYMSITSFREAKPIEIMEAMAAR